MRLWFIGLWIPREIDMDALVSPGHEVRFARFLASAPRAARFRRRE